MHKIDQLLDRVDRIPSAPKLLVQLLGELGDVNTELQRVVDKISVEPGLTAKILQTCNGALYGLSSPVDHVMEAVNRLGFQAIYHIVAVVSGEQLMQPTPKSGLDAEMLWRHAVTTAYAAQTIGKGEGVDASLLFTAGLLHDIGKLILGQVLPGDYARMILGSHLCGGPLVQVERSCFGVDHAAVGAHLLERWKFSPLLVASVGFHHDPRHAGAAVRFAACLEVADFLAHQVDDKKTGGRSLLVAPKEAQDILGIVDEQVAAYGELVEADQRFVDSICRANSRPVHASDRR